MRPIPTATPSAPPLQHIFYIMMENHGLNNILGNTADAPYLNQIANSYGIATRYFGVTHPSLPNYLAAISGSFQGIWDDCPAGASVTCAPQAFGGQLTGQQANQAASTAHLFAGQNLVDQLEAHGLTWKAYMQSLPATGFTGGYAGLYGQKHDPFMYFADIRNSLARMQRIVPFTQFSADLQSGNIPNFAWITPDVCNDMHGASNCSGYDSLIAQGDAFVRSAVSAIMSSPAWKAGAAIVIAWDESDASNDGCCNSPVGAAGAVLGGGNVPLIVLASRGPHHLVLGSQSYNHYSLLATIEQLWGLGCLANTCGISQAQTLTPLFEA
ncbi:MAG TPA: alkaline phosphatase family protein [Ktedonobacteraceae bacterium]|nr:alkaline phosphatase family protein [Ktedonobacteraceae bacterium]